MSEISVPLTEDEYTLLLIAADGGSIAAIGKWEKPVEGLVRRGYMLAHDKFNHTITAAGKAVAEGEEDGRLRDVINANNRAHGQISAPRNDATELVTQAAVLILRAAQLTAPISGHDVAYAIDQWAMAAASKAKESL